MLTFLLPRRRLKMLTFSLPRRRLKMTDRSARFEILKPLMLLFAVVVCFVVVCYCCCLLLLFVVVVCYCCCLLLLLFVIFFVVDFALARERISTKTHIIESRFLVLGPESILFAGLCAHFSGGEIWMAGAVKGLN